MITRTATSCLVDEVIVEQIVNFQAKDASNAVKVYNEVEFVGFGKFLLREYKVKKRISNLEKGIQNSEAQLEVATSEVRIKYLKAKIEGMIKQLQYLKSKLK